MWAAAAPADGFGPAGSGTQAASDATPPAAPDPPPPAQPPPAVEPKERYRYALGMAVVADRTGEFSNVRLRALGAYNFGEVRISTSYIGSILTFGADERERGAIADLYRSRRWSFGAGLRLDSGSRPAQVREVDGLPDINRTVRASFYVRYDFDRHWRGRLTLLPDLLGRQEGVAAVLGISYTTLLSRSTEGSVFTSVAFGDRRHLQTYFAVSEGMAQRSGLPAFSPGGGLSQVELGTSVIHAFHRRWIAFAGAGTSRIVGSPADSPLLHSRWASAVYAGIGYRCC
ncbi:MAG TPA: MipA/OmpV family protein [Burkholderiaceae bacterium]|nr:MipA/OmpV family protein [Burkholderiaceae bacterium]